jgi:hypothetical protein
MQLCHAGDPRDLRGKLLVLRGLGKRLQGGTRQAMML